MGDVGTKRRWLVVALYFGHDQVGFCRFGMGNKELIREEVGDGIMSAIDFSVDVVRQQDPKGDRLNVVLLGTLLPYKTY